MYVRYGFCLVALVLSYCSAYTQTIVTMMHYNLLYYGKNTGFCHASNNSLTTKRQYLQDILSYVQPDVFTVNELDGDGSEPVEDDAVHLLDHTLNVNGRDHYRKAPFQSTYLANTLFYNSSKLKLHNWESIPLHVGDHEKIFNAYTFYHNASHLAPSSDTTFLTCFVIHLKSGNNNENTMQRANEAKILTDFIQNEMPDSGNYIICGDLNVYGSDEEAFRIFTDPEVAKSGFYDPVDQPGRWHDNETYKLFHTQSTHTGGTCFSGGGMDDRFDFILLSGTIMEGTKNIKYISESYQTIGQDGGGFNSSLRIDRNEDVPDNIAKALYNFSDHLPVSLELWLDEETAVELSFDTIFHRPGDPVQGDSVYVYAQMTDTEEQVSSVRLVWGSPSSRYSNHSEMKLSGNYYFAGLKGTEESSKVYYKVQACDSSGTVLNSAGGRRIAYSGETAARCNESGETVFKISNPVQNQMDLFFSEIPPNDLSVMIIDATGRVRIRKSYARFYGKKLSLSVASLQEGIYWVKVQNKNAVHVNLFIKQ